MNLRTPVVAVCLTLALGISHAQPVLAQYGSPDFFSSEPPAAGVTVSDALLDAPP